MTVYYSDLSTKIDNLAVDGLTGTYNSLAYEVGEIEHHLHHRSRWFGRAVTPSAGVNEGDLIGTGVAAFQADAGDTDWGSWIPLLGTGDTPAITSMVYFDPHRIMVTAAERTAPYGIQFAWGDTDGDTAYAASDFSDMMFIASATGIQKGGPIEVGVPRIAVGTKLWARAWCYGQNTGTIDFYIGIHEYLG